MFTHAYHFSLTAHCHLSHLTTLSSTIQSSRTRAQSTVRKLQTALSNLQTSLPQTAALVHSQLNQTHALLNAQKTLHKKHLARLLFSATTRPIRQSYTHLRALRRRPPALRKQAAYVRALRALAQQLALHSASDACTRAADSAARKLVARRAHPHALVTQPMQTAGRIRLQIQPSSSPFSIRLLSGARVLVGGDSRAGLCMVRNIGEIKVRITCVHVAGCPPCQRVIVLPPSTGLARLLRRDATLCVRVDARCDACGIVVCVG